VKDAKPKVTGARFRIGVTILAAALGLAGCGASDTTADGPSGTRDVAVVTPGDTTPPTTPSSISATIITPTRIGLNWAISRDNQGVVGYRIYRSGALLVTLGNTTSYQDSTVVASTTYSYTVQAFDAAGNASMQSPAAIVATPATLDTTPPTAPTGLVATPTSSSRVTLTWNAATDNVAVTGYIVYRNGSQLISVGNVTAYQDIFLAPATTYIYAIVARDAAGNESVLSGAATATTLGAVDTTPPTAPGALTAGAVSPTQINLSWTASTDNDAVANYRVYRNGAFLAILADQTTYHDVGLAPLTMYTYNVDSIDAAGNVSPLSAPADATTPSAPDTIPPLTPTGLTATPISASRINLSWNASLDNVAVSGYEVRRNGALLATLGTVTVYQDAGLAASTAYSYRVRAFDAAGNQSPLSSSVSATTLAAADTQAPTTPTGLGATAVSDTQIDLNWTASTDNVAVTGYRVYRNGSFLVSLGKVTAYQNTGLTPSTMYTYNVDAIDAVGNASSVSAAASATTQAPNTTATLEWDPVAGAANYLIYYGTAPRTYLQAPGAGIAAGNVTTYTVMGLSRGVRYYFAATAVDGSNNESALSNEVFKDIP
jgi:chitodextrinase